MKFKYLPFIGMLGFSLLAASTALADGIFFSSEQFHLYSPVQKAIITWDGKTEQMVLASKVRADKISNIAWLIPIQSTIKPDVEKSNFSIFKDITTYFGRKETGGWISGRDQSLGKETTEGVEVIETKKVDIYDVAILKATSADDLLQWLKTNGYQVPEDTKAIIAKYIQRPSMYFVANKINLQNNFRADVQEAQEFYERIKQRLEQKRHKEAQELKYFHDEQTAFCSSWQTTEKGLNREKEFSACVIDKVKKRFLQMGKVVQTIAPAPHFRNTSIFSIDHQWTVTFADFEKLDNAYFFIRLNDQMVLTDHFPKGQGRDIAEAKYLPTTTMQKAVGYADTIHTVLAEELAVKKDLDQQIQTVTKASNDIDAILAAISQWSESSFFCGFDSFPQNFPEGARRQIMIDASSGIAPDSVKLGSKYCRTISTLQAGLATPLKISFQPNKPYYPLEISSLAEGTAMIDVYVIADSEAIDDNRAFTKAKSLALNKTLKEKINKEFQFGPWSSVTRFTWSGQLKDLNKDAEFGIQ